MSARNAVIVIGSGMMGSGIAACSAAAGNPTVLVDVDLKRAEAGVSNARDKLNYLAQVELLDAAQAEKASALLQAEGDMEKALSGARLVIEAVTEDLALKQSVFARVDSLLPEEFPIASNTSGLRITDIAKEMKHPQRAVTTHFWFPAHLVPLVEVVVGDQTDLAVAQQVYDELQRWAKAPVLVKKDLPGQLANRILQAVIRESVNIVEIGLASAQDVDTAVKMGMGIRFPVWGPLEHVDSVGLKLCKSVQDTVLPEISNRQSASAYFDKLMAQGCSGVGSSKGFYDWTVRDNQQLQENRDKFIVNALKFMRTLD